MGAGPRYLIAQELGDPVMYPVIVRLHNALPPFVEQANQSCFLDRSIEQQVYLWFKIGQPEPISSSCEYTQVASSRLLQLDGRHY